MAVVNAETITALQIQLECIIEHEGVLSSPTAAVVLGGDTRSSSPGLLKAACEGVRLAGARVIDIGTCTTPMLHYHVLQANDSTMLPYLDRLVAGYKQLAPGGCTALASSGTCRCHWHPIVGSQHSSDHRRQWWHGVWHDASSWACCMAFVDVALLHHR
jgi:Phosphoglucomutase/phosphomannomutase, alpha/beta/alpha domain I